MAHRVQKALSAVFLAVAGSAAATGMVPTPLTATAPADAATVASASSVAPVIIILADEEDRRVTGALLADPSSENIERFLDRGIGETRHADIVRQSLEQMHLPAGLKAGEVTEDQRAEFLQRIAENQVLYEMSAPTAAEAEKRGLQERLSKYFDTCGGGASGMTTAQAKTAEECMEHLQWEKDAKPLLIKVGVGTGTVVAAGAGAVTAAVLKKRRESRYRY